MQFITLSGKVYGTCELKKDINGNDYIRFKLCCTGKDYGGKVKYTIYRCFCYDVTFRNLKNGDKVFLAGDIAMNIKTGEDGNACVQNDVYVKCISV